MIRLTDELCARCDDRLATSNKHKDRLCGKCQRELGASRGSKSLAYREWVQRGRKREVTRVKPEAPAAIEPTSSYYGNGSGLAAVAPTMETKDLIVLIERATTELQRRKSEAEELLKLLRKPTATDREGSGGEGT